VFDVIPADEHEAPTGIDVACFQHTQPLARLAAGCSLKLATGQQTAGEPSQQQEKQYDGDEGKRKLSNAPAILAENRIEPIPHSDFPI
jgi:hypothetical protein